MAQSALEARLQRNLNAGTLRLDAGSGQSGTRFGGTLAVGSLTLPVTGTLIDSETWQVTAAAPISAEVAVASLLPLVSDPSILSFLPLDEKFSRLSLVQFALDLGAGSPDRASLAYTLQSADEWQVVPGSISIKKFGVTVRATRDRRPAAEGQDPPPPQTSFSGQIFGTSRIGNYDLEVAVGVNGGTVWTVDVGSDKNPVLPSLADLAAFM